VEQLFEGYNGFTQCAKLQAARATYLRNCILNLRSATLLPSLTNSNCPYAYNQVCGCTQITTWQLGLNMEVAKIPKFSAMAVDSSFD